MPPKAKSAAAKPKKSSKPAKPRDVDAPKKPVNGYLLYSAAERENMKSNGVASKDLTGALSEAWKEIDKKSKRYKDYMKIVEDDKERYADELAEYEKTGKAAPSSITVIGKDSWSTILLNEYLGGKSSKGGKKAAAAAAATASEDEGSGEESGEDDQPTAAAAKPSAKKGTGKKAASAKDSASEQEEEEGSGDEGSGQEDGEEEPAKTLPPSKNKKTAGK